MWDGIVSFFTEGIPNFINSIIEWIQDLPNKIGEIIGFILGKIIEFGVNCWNWIKTEVPKMIENVINFVKELPGKIWNWLVETTKKVIQFGIDMKNKAIETGSNFINNIVNFIKNLPTNIWNWLQNTIQKVQSFVLDIGNKAREGGENFFNNIVNTIREIPNNIANIGRDIVEGLWNGIQNAGTWIKNKVANFAQGILTGMKNALGIHSPSTLFRDEVGKFIALGVGEGFSDNIKSVYKKMKSSVDFETQKLNANLTTTSLVNIERNANITATLNSIDNDREITVNAVTNLDSNVLTRAVDKVKIKQKLAYGIS